MKNLLSIDNLTTNFNTIDGNFNAVKGISFHLKKGESLAIVGESGSGKSVSALSILQLNPTPQSKIINGEIIFNNKNLLNLNKQQIKNIRGNEISMIFQDPMTSLNPVLKVGLQLTEGIRKHYKINSSIATNKALEMLRLVGIPDPNERINHYPYQFSGGQRQRLGIAMALMCDPSLLIADEPTTALDVTIQAQIIQLVSNLQKKLGMAIIWITHDLGVVAGLVDKVIVMYSGHILEKAPIDRLYKYPSHPYTKGLLESIPTIDNTNQLLVPIKGIPPNIYHKYIGCPFFDRCKYSEPKCQQVEPSLNYIKFEHETACWKWDKIHEKSNYTFKSEQDTKKQSDLKNDTNINYEILKLSNLKKYYDLYSDFTRKKIGLVKAVDGVTISINQGEALGIVGESGCGKSTIARMCIGLLKPTSGEIQFDGKNISIIKNHELRNIRKDIQIIFQDPYSSLNPTESVGNIIKEGLEIHKIGDKQYQNNRVSDLMQLVGLDPSFAKRYPHEFSGGQRQRIGIARALATEPKLILADEPISALDISIQAQIINLLIDLKNNLKLTFLFIAHDLSMVRYFSDRVAVMYLGRIVEIGSTKKIFEKPLHPYTHALQSANPIPDPEREKLREQIVLKEDIPSPKNPPKGCYFHTRCKHKTDICEKEYPLLKNYGDEKNNHYVACIHAEKFL